jgi:hypothetical protein
MFKRLSIFIFLASAYTLLLAHNFTPHTHHSEQQTHQHKDGGHHHHNNHGEEQEEENTTAPFHLLQHTGGAAIVFIPGQPVQINPQNLVLATPVIKYADYVLKQVEKPPLLLPASRKQYLPLPQSTPYFFLLKAPPAFIA